MRAPRNAKSVLSYVGHRDGTASVTFALEDGTRVECLYYHPYPFKDDPMTEARDLLLKFWTALDDLIDTIRKPYENPNALDLQRIGEAKIKATTHAELLATIMSRFYPDSQAVLRESMARWQARQDGVEHDTPGLAEALWDPSARADGTPYSVAAEAEARTGRRRSGGSTATAQRTGNRVPDSAVDTAKKGIEMGMFTVEQMAKTYKMSVPELKEQLGLV